MKKFRSILPLFVVFCMVLQTTVFAKAPNSFDANRIVIGTHEISAIDTQKLFNAVRTIAEGEENHYYFSIMGVDEDFNDKLYWVDLLAEDPTAELIGSDLPSDFKITHLDGEPVGDLSEVSTIKVKPAFEGVISMEGTTLKVPELSSADFIKYAIEATDGSKQTYAVDLEAKTLVVTPEKTGATTATYTIEFIKGGGGGTTDAALEKALLQETIDVANIIYVASIESATADKLLTFKTAIDTAKEEVNKDLDAAGYKTANTNLVNAINAFLVPEGMYTITIDSSIQNGTVKADKPMAKKDDVITLTVTPANGYQLKAGSLKANDIVITDNTFTMPEVNVTITAEFEQIAEATLSSITVTKPTKTKYNIGDTLDTTGMVVTGTYSDGTTKDVTSLAAVTGFDSTTVGQKTITVTVDGKTATFTITVIDINLPDAEKPTITTNLATTDTVYNVGDSAVLTVVAEVTDGGALTYQWHKDNIAITNANLSTYTVNTTKADSEATYYVEITNTKENTNLSTVKSNELKVTVKEEEAETLEVTFNSNDITKGTVEAHVYDSDNKETIVTTSPTQVASGSKVVFLAKPISDNVLDKWNSDNTQLEVTYTIEEVTANETVTANFIAKDKTPLAEAISGANVYAEQISNSTILVKANNTTANEVENGKKFVTEIEKDAFTIGLGLAEKLFDEVHPVVIETQKQITTAAEDLNSITNTFSKFIKTGTKSVETTKYTVTGGVYGENVSTPLSGAIVKVTDQVYNTNSEGLYTITNVTDGTYNLEISQENYGTKTVTLTVSGTTVTASGATVTVSGNNITVSDVILTNVINDKLLKATVTKVVYDNTTLTDAAEISVVTYVYGEVIDAVYTENSKVKFTFSAVTDMVSDVKITGTGNDGSTPITPATFAGTPTYDFTLENISLSDLISEGYRIKIELTVNDNNQPLTTYQNASTKVTYFVKFEQKSSN